MADEQPPKKQQSGVEAVAEMLQHMTPPERAKLMANVAAQDPVMAQKIEAAFFGFGRIAGLDADSIRFVIQNSPKAVLLLALRSVSEDVSRAVFGALSTRASESLREEIQDLGPRLLSEVQAAQSQIGKLMRGWHEAGKIKFLESPK